MIKYVYKICLRTEWNVIKKNGKFYGTKKDLLDGFIHLSNRGQIKFTLKRYFANKKNLILLKISTLNLKNLIWEKSTNGILFPHLYSSISLKDIKNSFKIILNKNRLHFILLKN
tara:strand:+ start:135 stop:476 length:342 start_codon:yes stop_codon:yes gene_type:complete